MSNPRVVVNTPRKGPKVFTVVLTTTDLIWMGVGAALALTIFFVFGLLVGRGYFPAQEEFATPAQMHQAEQPEPEVLRPEELTYPERISEQKPKPKPKPAEAANATVPAESAAEAVVEPGAEAEADQEGAAIETAAPEAVQADTGSPVFEYIYQVAAFKEQSMAQDLADKLGAKGLSADIAQGDNKGVTWYRVRVLHTGTPPSTRELRDVIFEITQVKPMLVSKKPVE